MLISHEWPVAGGYTGGIGTHFAALATGFAELGHDVTVLTTGQGADERQPDGVMVRRLPPSRLPGLRSMEVVTRGIRFVSALRHLGHTDLVLAPEYGAWAWPLALRRPSAGPTLVTSLATSLVQIHEVQPRQPRNRVEWLQWQIQYRLERFQARRSDSLVPISTAIECWTQALWGLEGVPSRVIPNVVDPAELAIVEPLQTSQPTVVFVGRVCEWKGADLAIRAMRDIWDQGLTAQLVLAGRLEPLDGLPPADFVARELPEEWASRVSLTGHLDRPAVLGWLSAADVAVFPSRFEGFGIAALEAKFLGRPVVVTSGSGFDDFCRDGVDSRVVPPGDVAALADAIRDLLVDRSSADQLGRAAAESSARFTAVHAAKSLLEFVEEVRGA